MARPNFSSSKWFPIALVSVALVAGVVFWRLSVAPVAPPAPSPVPTPAPRAAPDYEQLMTAATRFVESQQPERSLKLYESALAMRPGDPEALFGRGIARLQLRDTLGAVRDFEAALAKEPTFADAVYGLAEAHRLSENPAAARVQYERYLEIDPEGRYAKDAREKLGQ